MERGRLIGKPRTRAGNSPRNWEIIGANMTRGQVLNKINIPTHLAKGAYRIRGAAKCWTVSTAALASAIDVTLVTVYITWFPSGHGGDQLALQSLSVGN